MADPTFQNHYRQTQISAYAQRDSMLRHCTERESVLKGNVAYFQVSNAGTVQASTRGTNGLIAYGRTDNTQVPVTLVETHATASRTSFDITSTQGNMVQQMQIETVGTLNANVDQAIIDQLDTATQDVSGGAQTASLDMFTRGLAILGNGNVPVTEAENMFGLMSPAMHAYCLQMKEWASREYVDVPVITGGFRKMTRWLGVNWMVHTQITGNGTSAEKCYIWHRKALGHAANSDAMAVFAGYDEQQDYSWARCTLHHGCAVLQNTGIVRLNHDGSAMAAA